MADNCLRITYQLYTVQYILTDCIGRAERLRSQFTAGNAKESQKCWAAQQIYSGMILSSSLKEHN